MVGTVSGDPERLQQVFWNLLSNAVKFTAREAAWNCVSSASAPRAVVIVSDTGIGIRPDLLDAIFERFRQADGSIARAHGGLGLGLAIVRQLVELHGGTVEAASPGEGQGATFTVTLAPAVDGGTHRGGESVELRPGRRQAAARAHTPCWWTTRPTAAAWSRCSWSKAARASPP